MGRIRGISTAGARGPMQFLPTTWDLYGEGGDINDPRDAILAAARLLRANGAPGDMGRAVWHYNPSSSYVGAVTRYAKAIGARRSPSAATGSGECSTSTSVGPMCSTSATPGCGPGCSARTDPPGFPRSAARCSLAVASLPSAAGPSGPSASEHRGTSMANAATANPGSSAVEVLGPVLRRQVEELRSWESGVRLDRSQAVHRYRVAARRLRSNLAGFRALLDADTCGELGSDLRSAGVAAGGARDAETVRRHVEALMRDESDPSVGATRERSTGCSRRRTAEAGGTPCGTSTRRSTTPSPGVSSVSPTCRPGRRRRSVRPRRYSGLCSVRSG